MIKTYWVIIITLNTLRGRLFWFHVLNISYSYDFTLIVVSWSHFLATSAAQLNESTHTHIHNRHSQSKPHFVLTITPGLPFMERGIRKTLTVSRFFLYSLGLFFGVGQIVPPVGLIMLGLFGHHDNTSWGLTCKSSQLTSLWQLHTDQQFKYSMLVKSHHLTITLTNYKCLSAVELLK